MKQEQVVTFYEMFYNSMPCTEMCFIKTNFVDFRLHVDLSRYLWFCVHNTCCIGSVFLWRSRWRIFIFILASLETMMSLPDVQVLQFERLGADMLSESLILIVILSILILILIRRVCRMNFIMRLWWSLCDYSHYSDIMLRSWLQKVFLHLSCVGSWWSPSSFPYCCSVFGNTVQ